MTDTLDAEIPGLAADHLDEYGWTAGWGIHGPGRHGRTCAHGAVLSVCGAHPGDVYLWRRILDLRGLTIAANDTHDKRWSTRRLRKFGAPTVPEMVEGFGPCWEPVRDVVRQAAVLTPTQAAARVAAWDAAWDAAGDAARDAARVAARDAAWVAARAAAWDAARAAAGVAARVAARVAAWDAAGDAARAAARAAAWDAALGVVVVDLIGDRFTREHFDVLTGPWADVVGLPVSVDRWLV